MRRFYIYPPILCVVLLAVAACVVEVDGPLPVVLFFGGTASLVLGLLLATVEFFWIGRVYTRISSDRVLWWTVLLNFFGSLSCFGLSMIVSFTVGAVAAQSVPVEGPRQFPLLMTTVILAIVASYPLAVAVEYALLRRLQRGRQEIEPVRLRRICWFMNGVTHGVVLVLFLGLSLLVFA